MEKKKCEGWKGKREKGESNRQLCCNLHFGVLVAKITL